jgi:hypothetical protein
MDMCVWVCVCVCVCLYVYVHVCVCMYVLIESHEIKRRHCLTQPHGRTAHTMLWMYNARDIILDKVDTNSHIKTV